MKKENKANKENKEKNIHKNVHSDMEHKKTHTESKAKKENPKSPKKDIEFLWIAALVGVAFLGTYAFLPWHGMLSSFPLVIVSAFACTFLKTGEILKNAVFFLLPFSVCILLDESVFLSVFLSVCCVAFYYLAYFSVKLYKKGKSGFRFASAVLLIVSLSLHVFVNSTPWSNASNTDAIKNYISNNYSDEKMLISDIHFNSFNRTYNLSMIPDTDNTIELEVVFKDGILVKDEYINYSEKYNMIVGAGKITSVLRNKFPSLGFVVESNSIKGYPFYVSEGVHLATTAPLINYSRYMDYSIYFTSYNSVEEFIAVAEESFRTLLTSGFCCRQITFYGGISTRYVAKITVPFSSFVGHLENYITPCDSNLFSYSFAS